MLSRKQKKDKKKLGSRAGPTPSPPTISQNRYGGEIKGILDTQISEYATALKNISKNKSVDKILIDLKALNDRWSSLTGNYSTQIVKRIVEEMIRTATRPWDALIASGDLFETGKRVSIGIGNIYTTPEMRTVVSSIVSNNVSLIQKSSDGVSERIKNVVTQHLTSDPSGISLESKVSKILKDVGKYSKYRSRLIAKDQTRKMIRAFSRHRAMSLGIEKYVWSDMNDANVRPKHELIDGREFRYDTGAPPSYSTMPVVGDGFHPGEDIACRCIDIPILPKRGNNDNNNDGK